MMKNRILLLSLLIAGMCFQSIGQPAKQLVQVIVTPDNADWTYDKGERAEFQIMVLKNNVPLQDVEVSYRINPEKMDNWEEGKLTLKKGVASVKAKRFNDPGFLRCHASVDVDGKTYTSYATAGFSPNEIEPTTTLPADFEQFWKQAKDELAKVPVNPVLTLMPERCTSSVDVYHVSIDNINGKIYGILSKPKAEGKYPAILYVPGAGIRPYYGGTCRTEKGIITSEI